MSSELPPGYDKISNFEDEEIIENIQHEAFEMVINNIKKTARKKIEDMKKNYESQIEDMKKNYESQIEDMKKNYESQIVISPETRDFIVPYLEDANRKLTEESINCLEKYKENFQYLYSDEENYKEKTIEYEKLSKEKDFFIEQYKNKYSFIQSKLSENKILESKYREDLKEIDLLIKNTDCTKWEKIKVYEYKEIEIQRDIIIHKRSCAYKKVQELTNPEKNMKINLSWIDQFKKYEEQLQDALKRYKETLENNPSNNIEISEKNHWVTSAKNTLNGFLYNQKGDLKIFIDENKIFSKFSIISGELCSLEISLINDKKNLFYFENEKIKSFEKTITCENLLKYLK